MKKILFICAVALLAMALPLSAAITWGPWAETPTTLSGSANWTGMPAPETASTVTPGGNWWVELVMNATMKTDFVLLHVQHLVGPHLGDNAPGEIIEAGLIFPIAPMGHGMVYEKVAHGGHAQHSDVLDFKAHSDVPGVGVTFDVTHVPEPSTYALLAGLGLAGFAALRRFRR